MKLFRQLLIILGINLAGEIISHLLKLPLPGSIVGLLLLLVLLTTGIVREKQIAETADFLLNNMGFFFIPAGVSIMISHQALKGNYLQTLFIILVSTLLVITISSLATQFLIKRKHKGDGKNN